MKILVTGGCGFIGVNLIEKLLAKDHAVRVLDDLSVGRLDDLEAISPFNPVGGNGPYPPPQAGEVQVLIGDIRDIHTISEGLRDIDAVIHLAAQCGMIPSIDDPHYDCQVNIFGTLNLLKASVENQISKFIFASSSAPLGDQEPPAHEMKVPKPLSPYGASKLAGEAYCSAFHGSFGLKTIALRFSNVYGPHSRRKGSVIAAFFKRALQDQPMIIYGDGNQTRDFLYVDDLCGAIIKSLYADVAGEIFQIATSEETTVNKVAEHVKRIAERDTGKQVQIAYEDKRSGEIIRSCSDITKARKLLNYEPQIDLETGIECTWKWFRKNYQILWQK